jgi:hypothetical protein
MATDRMGIKHRIHRDTFPFIKGWLQKGYYFNTVTLQYQDRTGTYCEED